ncbi:MAG: hypothetical protein IPM79_19960 [Polyangiaceae bacterium]|nr:hypothetical protein [Polyangiaceae bacterium]
MARSTPTAWRPTCRDRDLRSHGLPGAPSAARAVQERTAEAVAQVAAALAEGG